MSWFKKEAPAEEYSEIALLSERIEELTGQIRALGKEKDQTGKVNQLTREITELEISKAKLVEDNAREVREVEHRVGLLQKKQEQDVEHATRMAKLEVQEGNLQTERDRFEKEMAFQREHFTKESENTREILTQVLAALPNVNATLNVDRSAPAAAPRRAPAKKKS